MCAKTVQSCPTLCNPMDCSPPGSSIHGILHARILEWVAVPPSRESQNYIKKKDWGTEALEGGTVWPKAGNWQKWVFCGGRKEGGLGRGPEERVGRCGGIWFFHTWSRTGGLRGVVRVDTGTEGAQWTMHLAREVGQSGGKRKEGTGRNSAQVQDTGIPPWTTSGPPGHACVA